MPLLRQADDAAFLGDISRHLMMEGWYSWAVDKGERRSTPEG